jgi:hypothetical protein
MIRRLSLELTNYAGVTECNPAALGSADEWMHVLA